MKMAWRNGSLRARQGGASGVSLATRQKSRYRHRNKNGGTVLANPKNSNRNTAVILRGNHMVLRPNNAHQNRGRDPLLGSFAANRNNPRRAVAQLKSQRSYRQAKKIIEGLRPFRLENYIYENRIAESWNRVLELPQYPNSADWIQEVGWLSHGFRAYASTINSFLSYRKAFGTAYLLGDYARAEVVLAQVKEEHGHSFWLAERLFMVRQAVGGFDAHKKLLAEMQSETTNPLVGYIFTTLSNRLEPHVNHESFKTWTEQMLRELRQEGHDWLAAIIEIQISPWTQSWKSQAQEMLRCCAGRPLIDRYDRTIKILAYMSFDGLADNQRQDLTVILQDLGDVIEDRQLTHIQWATLGTATDSHADPNSESYLNALDQFVSGKFAESAELAEILLKQDPTSFDFYWLLARAIACCPKPYETALSERSFASDILKNVQAVAENRVDLNVPLLALLTIALKLGDNHIGISLWQFAEREYSGEISKEACRYASIQGKIHSPEPPIDGDRTYHLRCIEELQRVYPSHLSLDLAVYRHDLNSSEIQLPDQLATSFACIARAERAARNEKHRDVLSHLTPLLQNSDGNSNKIRFQSQYAVLLEFNALISLEQPEAAAAAVLKCYTVNPNLLRHMPFEQLIEGAESNKWGSLRGQIYWPILVYLNNGDEHDIYEAVDDFVHSQGYSSPVQLIDGKVQGHPNALRILLRDVLVPSVIARGALWARTQEDRRNLRTMFLQALYALSVEDQEFVVQELSELDQARILEKAYQNVEGSKFFLEFGELNKSLAALLEGPYERYCSFRDYEEKGGQLAAETDLLELAKTGASIKPVDEKRAETSEFILRNLATYVFGQYLFHPDKGINATLRTRIIHGALENQIKRVLGARSLLAEKDLTGNYRCDKSVISRISDCTHKDREIIERAYIHFTESITSIYESLITAKLRIKIPSDIIAVIDQPGFSVRELISDQGIIDFSGLFEDVTFTRLRSSQSPTSSGFVTDLHNVFVAQAREAFRFARQFIGADLSQQIYSAISSLDNAVVSALDDSPLRASLRADIIAAKDEIAHDLGIIQKWFSAATYMNTGIGSVAELIATAGRVVGNASNDRLGQLIKGQVSDDKLDFEAAVALYEVLSILLRNVVQHSGIDSGQEVEYHFDVCGTGRKTLTLINKVSSEEVCAAMIEKARLSIHKPSDPRVLDRSPGGTGLARIRALLAPHSTGLVELEVQQNAEPIRFTVKVTY